MAIDSDDILREDIATSGLANATEACKTKYSLALPLPVDAEIFENHLVFVPINASIASTCVSHGGLACLPTFLLTGVASPRKSTGRCTRVWGIIPLLNSKSYREYESFATSATQ